MIDIAVCDDSKKDLADICAILDAYSAANPDLNVQYSGFESAFSLLQSIEEHGGYDLYIVDLIMPGVSGLELISNIRKKDKEVPVIILTHSKEYALEAYSLDVCQYILKPVGSEALFEKLNKITEGMKSTDDEYAVFHLNSGVSRIKLGSIICVELSDHVMSFYLSDGKMLESKYLRKPFAEAAGPILQDPRFLRPHHSFIINMNYVDKMTKQFFYMNNGRIVKIAKQKSKEATAQYMHYVSGRWKN